jgi:Family of unknown function (DUF5686)/CarboxypepD_reg-like domain
MKFLTQLSFLAVFQWFALSVAGQEAGRATTAASRAISGIGKHYYFNGKIKDRNTQEGVPFATVAFPGTPFGAVADLDGNFTITGDHMPTDSLRFGALGYKYQTKHLTAGTVEATFEIELERDAAELSEFTVHADGVDPALLLLRRIIEHKPQNNPDKAANYRYEAYNRLELDMKNLTGEQARKRPFVKNYGFVFNNMDTTSEAERFLPVYFTEALSDYYFRSSPKKQREIIKGVVVEGINNTGFVDYLGSSYQNINIYRNGIPVFDKKFVSPISNEGPLFYHYAIKDTEKAFGHNIILVQFEPRRKGELCFSGDFWVVDSVYAIQRVNLEVPKSVNFNWADKITIYQEFAPVDSFWFGIKDKFVAHVSAYGTKKIPGFVARKTTTYHNIVINDTATEREIDNPEWKEDIVKHDADTGRSQEWWAAHRPDSLTKNEQMVHKMVDTVLKMPITTHYINTMTFLISGVKDFGPIELGPYWYVYSSNPIEGSRVRFSFGTPRTLKDLHVAAYVAYGFTDQAYKYGLESRWVLKRKPWTYLRINLMHDLSQGIDNFDHVRSDNVFSNLVRKPGAVWKQALDDRQRVQFDKTFFSGVTNSLILSHRTFTPYAPLPNDMFVDQYGKPALGAQSTEAAAEMRYTYKEKFIDSKYSRKTIGTKYPIFDLLLTAGFKDLIGGAYGYRKVNFSVKESINTPPFGHLNYNLFGGKYFGTLPYPLLEVHPGNDYLYYDPHSFEMMRNYEFISDQFIGLNVEQGLGGGIFNHIPLVRKLKLRQFLTAKGIWGSLSADNTKLNLNSGYPFRTLSGNPYLEVGTAVSNILRVIRIDFVWRVTPKPLATDALSSYFGIFGGFQLEF